MFEFDPVKAASNLAKHGIDFAEAEPVLYDPMAFSSSRNVGGELRHITTGMDGQLRVITVVWTQRGIHRRLISARPATRKEREVYGS